jgi:hypothetical protein
VLPSRCLCRLYSGLFYGTFGGGDIARLIDRCFHRVVDDFHGAASGATRFDAICDLSSEPFSEAKVRAIVS